MRIGNILILGLMALVSACSSVSIKPDSDIAVRQNGHPFAYWHTTTGGCRVADEVSMDNYRTYEWSGRCENGLVTGCGQLLARSVAANGALIEQMDGCFSTGLKNGAFREIIQTRERDTFRIGYVDGLAVSYTKESPTPPPSSPPPPARQLPDDPKTVGRGMRGG